MKDRRKKLHQVVYGISSFSALKVEGKLGNRFSNYYIKVTTKFPSVYTKVSYYVDWISDTIDNDEETNADQAEYFSERRVPELAPRGGTPTGPITDVDHENGRQTISHS